MKVARCILFFTFESLHNLMVGISQTAQQCTVNCLSPDKLRFIERQIGITKTVKICVCQMRTCYLLFNVNKEGANLSRTLLDVLKDILKWIRRYIYRSGACGKVERKDCRSL